jgi:phenylalanyl-tRNA synthetase beta chain
MIVSVEWLRNYVDVVLPVEELAHRLTMVGLEVEAVRQRNAFLERVLTVKLGPVRRHPNADHLYLCQVSDGVTSYPIVCGAPNVKEGSIVLLALPGAQLAGGMTIQEAQIRGQFSQGMLCSQKELGLGEDASGIWILPEGTPVGISVREALGIDDQIMDVAVTPNRSDCLSIIGIAREVAAICESPLRCPAISLVETGPDITTLTSIVIDDPEGCPRYAARIVQGITVGPSPHWLRERLEAVGLRSINNIVDVTNYVLMEMGQPLHAFDFDLLREHRIVVRRAEQGEQFTTLDGVKRTLFDDTLLICDGQGPVAIAGIMGGLDSEITPKTTRVLIESAYFEPRGIRRSSKKLGLRSESSYRFERGIDSEGVIRALDRAAQLMLETGGGEIARGWIDVHPRPLTTPVVILDIDRTNRFLGTDLSAAAIEAVLRRIELPVEAVDSQRLRVRVPSFRPDITREVDMAEEVARLVGFDQVPVTFPEASIGAEPADPHLSLRQEIKGVLQGVGFFEVLNYSFISQESLSMLGFSEDDPRMNPIRVLNPLSEDQRVMRTTLVPGLLQTVRYNFDHGNDDLRIFELSKVFLPRKGDALPVEPHYLAGVMAGARFPQTLYGGSGDIEFADLKGVVEEILELLHVAGVAFVGEKVPPYLDSLHAASIICEGSVLGAIGRVHPRAEGAFGLKKPVYVFEIDFERVYQCKRPYSRYRSLPKFPSVSRDMALIVDESLPVQELGDFIWQLQEPMLELIEVFDIYRNPQLSGGKKSIGYRLVYRSSDRSLTDAEVNQIHGGLVERVLDQFHATLRS